MTKAKSRHLFTSLILMMVLSVHTPVFSKHGITTLSEISNSFKSLSEQVSPAVVNIVAIGWTGPSEEGASALLSKSQSTGSGVIVDLNGFIVTNAHVVEDAHKIEVILNRAATDQVQFKSILKPRSEPVEAELIGLDQETDLAVLKIPLTGLSHLELANSDELQQGQLVLAFGSPMGLQNSVTMGVVSSVARQMSPDAPMIYIQTDAAINPGNSGGPLVNIDGKVVGINTFIFTQSGGNEGLGFAAPSNIVRNVYMQIKERGRVRRGEIGVKAQSINPDMAKGLGLQQNWGVILGDVRPESPADKAGLKIGDIVLSLNSKPMENGRQFNVNLYSKNVDDTVAIEALRKGKKMNFHVAVVEREDNYERLADLVTPEENLIEQLRILGLDLNANLVGMLPKLRTETGVLVAARIPTYSFSGEGFKPGDVIHAINQTPIAGLAGLRKALSNYARDESIVAQIERRGEFMYLAVQLQ